MTATGKTTDTLATFSTRHRRKTNKEINTTKKNEKMGNKDQTKEWPRTMVLVKVKDFLYHARHPSCYSHSQPR